MISEYQTLHITSCLLPAFIIGSVDLSTRVTSRRQCHWERVSSRDIEYHSNNQLLCWEDHRSVHPSTCARMAHSLFHWVHPEPSSCRLEQSDRTSRSRVNTSAARSKPVLVMVLAFPRDSGQSRSLQDCLSSPVPRPAFCSTFEPGPKS